MDLLQAGAIRFDQLQQLILDEADRMLDLGFSPELQKIMRYLPAQRQDAAVLCHLQPGNSPAGP